MRWDMQFRGFLAWRSCRRAWGARLDSQGIVLAALSRQQAGTVRVMVFEHLHAPDGLVHLSERDDWLVQSLRRLNSDLPATLRTMVLALCEQRSRQGVYMCEGKPDRRRLAQNIQLEAAAAWGVDPDGVSFDFSIDPDAPDQVQWASCLREELLQWQQLARDAGWRLPMVETENQAAQRAALRLREEALQHRAESPQDWQFSRQPVRRLQDVDWALLQTGPMWRPLVACGAALGAMT